MTGMSTGYTPRIMPQPKLYAWSTTIGSACANKMHTFIDLAEKLKMDPTNAPVQREGAPNEGTGQGFGAGAGYQRSLP
jgi:hypothetical protein